MSKKFKKTWEDYPKGLARITKRSKPLKSQINNALLKVDYQNNKINEYIERYSRRDNDIFEKIIQAQHKHDNKHASVLANELSEIRRHRDILMNSKLSLDNVSLRLRTIHEFGNTVSAITPVVDTLKNIRSGISNMMPEVSNELSQVETELSTIMVDVGGSTDTIYQFDIKNEDTKKIIDEAAMILESRKEIELPKLSNRFSLDVSEDEKE